MYLSRCKVCKGIKVHLVKQFNIFKVNQSVPYDVRKRNVLQRRNPNFHKYGTYTISYLAPKLW